MTAKNYLDQARRLDLLVDSKLEEIASLRSLATKATATISGSGVPNSTRSLHTFENIICKILDMESEINADIDRLLDLKREIAQAIQKVEQPDCRIVLEKRYLCFLQWDDIARDMGYSVDNIYILHKKALKMVVVPESLK